MARETCEAREDTQERSRRILALEGFGHRQGHLHLWKSVPHGLLRPVYKGMILRYFMNQLNKFTYLGVVRYLLPLIFKSQAERQ